MSYESIVSGHFSEADVDSDGFVDAKEILDHLRKSSSSEGRKSRKGKKKVEEIKEEKKVNKQRYVQEYTKN